MTKKLHLFITMLLCAVVGMVQAQEVTLDFTDNTNWQFPEGSGQAATESQSFTDENGNAVTLYATNGYYFNTQGYLMLGKAESTLTLPAFNFKVSSIVVVGRKGASASVEQNIFVGDQEVSTKTVGADGQNKYDINPAYQAAGNIYTLKVLSNHNTQITKILVYKEGSSVKDDPKLSFSGTSFTVNFGDEFTEPTLTQEGDGAVTYESSTPDVAEVNASTGEVTIKAVGNTKITATSAETANYISGSASYTLKVQEKTEPADNTFDFTGTNDYGTGLEPSSGSEFIYDDKEWTSGDVKLVTSGKYRWWKADSGNDLRFYSQKDENNNETTKMTISVPSGYTISKIEITGGQQFTSDDNLYSKGKWEGSANSVTLTYAGSSAVKVKTINVTYAQGGDNPPPETVYNSIAEIKQLDPKSSGKLKFNNVQVLYVNGKDMFAKDNTGAIDFYFEKTDNFNYTAGQKLNGTAVVTYDVYNEMPEITKVEDASLTATSGTATPITITASANLSDYVCQLVKLTGKFKKEGNNTFLTDGTNSIQIYNKWKLSDIDLAQVVEGSEGTATGIVVTYKSNNTIFYEIALTALEYQSAGLIDPELKFSAEKLTVTIGEDFTEPTLSAVQGFDLSKVTYSCKPTSVATVDATTGKLTINGAGSATVTATSEAYGTYLAGTASYALTVNKAPAQPGTEKFEYVDDVTKLVAGDVIILVAAEGEDFYGMSDQTGTYRSVEKVTLETDGTIIPNSYVQQITLEGAAGAWYLNVGNGYLYASSSNSNNIGTESEKDDKDNAKAAITNEEILDEEGETIGMDTYIRFQGENTRNDIRFNYNGGTNIRFSCYKETSDMTKVKIYRKVASGGLKGDVNGDGLINMPDVTSVINYILGKNPSPFIFDNADAKKDGLINMSDVTTIINIILGN